MPKPAREIKPEALSSSQVKDFCKRYIALAAEKKEASDAIKDLMAEVKSAGMEPKDFKLAVKVMENPIEQERKDGVNWILEINGQGRLFV